MLTSLALIFLLGIFMGRLFNKLKLPGLLGMLLAGMILGPYMLNVLDESLLDISGELRQIALVIILTRAGLSLNLADLKKVGRPTLLMCFVPACFEIVGVMIFAPLLLGVSLLEAAIMGSVVAAVSPAVIVPRMLRIMEEGYGEAKSIPQLILAAASVDDIFVIVLFSAFTGLASTGEISIWHWVQIPVSIVAGILLGVGVGVIIGRLLKRLTMTSTMQVLVVLSVSFLLLEIEQRLEGIIPVSGLLAIMSMGIYLKQKLPNLAGDLAGRYNTLWGGAEILLFALVGATVELSYVAVAGVASVMIVVLALMVRMLGVWICLIKSPLNIKERAFCMIAYAPKATVQAAIGGVPLAMGLACGHQVLTVAVLAILITAPFGAICVDKSYKKLLVPN